MEDSQKDSEGIKNISAEELISPKPTPSNKKNSKFVSTIKKNPWIGVCLIMVIVYVILLVLFVRGGVTGNVVSETTAADNLISFLSENVEGEIGINSIEDMGNIYMVNVEYQGDIIPVYVTKDGKYYAPSLVPLATTPSPTTTQPSDAPTEIVKSATPIVELFVMSHCPYGTQAEKGIIPVIELLGDKIDFTLRYVYYAMHGEIEVNEQANQYCIQKEQNDKFIDYLKCFLEEGDGESCLDTIGIDKNKLASCVASADTTFNIQANLENKDTWLSGQFPLFDIDKELNEEYGIRGSPGLVINGQQVSSARDPASYLETICAAFTNSPEECSESLSTSTYSPGFGYDAGSATTASCG